jgi:ABC-type nitrate/sulfonate/bicarbonate transport system substrate-binding protein
MYRLTVADLDSPSYFVAAAAADLGFFQKEGIEVELMREFGAVNGPEALRDGTMHFFGGPSFGVTRAFSGWKGAKLLCALSQYSYWFLAVRADLDIKRGDIQGLKGLRLSASPPWPEMSLRYMLAQAGLDLARDNVRIVPPPDTADWAQGYVGIEAIKRGTADGYWGNGMRVALGEQMGIAKMHIDLRRGDGPPGSRFYNFPALATSEKFIAEHPDDAAAAVRAIVKTQKALAADPSLATGVAERIFPAGEVPLIAELIRRDAPFYQAHITREAVDGLNKFATAIALIKQPVAYETLVATQFSQLWDS